MSDDNSLHRAHQLSAQASILVRRPDADRATLDRGLTAYREAAELFDAASRKSDESTRPTLKMLTNQHARLVRDVERRIAGLGMNPPSPRSPTTPKPGSPTSPADPFASKPADSPTSPMTPSRPMPQRYATSPAVGLAAGGGGVLGGAGLAVHATGARASVPPFAMRPVLEAPSTAAVPQFHPNSPLYSSSSSSEPPDESYLLPGAIPDTSDAFGRFWGMLENMMEEISFPKALTTAHARGLPSPTPTSGHDRKGSQDTGKGIEKTKGKERERERGMVDENRRTDKDKRKFKETPSPSESFYVVDSEKPSPTKSPEELALENASLRASLDALAVHAHTLEKANKDLRVRAEERDKMLQSMVSDVRTEARKARHQEVLRSQILNSTALASENAQGASRNMSTAPASENAQATAMRKRIAELEEEVRAGNKKLEESRQENVKLHAQLNKFKEKWDKLKAKKEAKEAARSRASEGV